MEMRKRIAAVLWLFLAAGMVVFSGCGKEKSEEETQIKELVKESPTPTVQPEADNPENTQTKDGVSMTNDYLNQKEAGQAPNISDNENVSSEDSTDLGENGADGSGDQTGAGEDGSGEETADQDGSDEQ